MANAFTSAGSTLLDGLKWPFLQAWDFISDIFEKIRDLRNSPSGANLLKGGEIVISSAKKAIGLATGSYATEVNPMYPTGPYARDGALQWYGRGQSVVARHQDGTTSTHAASLIVPGIQNGPAESLPLHAVPDGSNPVMRMRRGPDRSWRLAMPQHGAWSGIRAASSCLVAIAGRGR